MERFYGYRLGTYDDRASHLTVSGEPSLNDVERFAVSVHYADPTTEETIQVARIDTSHGYVHVDRLYRADQPTDEIDVETPWEAEAVLRSNWRQYAESHARNHR